MLVLFVWVVTGLTLRSAKRAYSKAQYLLNPDKKKCASRAYFKARYSLDPLKRKADSKAWYKVKVLPMTSFTCVYCRLRTTICPHAVFSMVCRWFPYHLKLVALSGQVIQKPKCYHTVVRLGTYTAKVPVYNSLENHVIFTIAFEKDSGSDQEDQQW